MIPRILLVKCYNGILCTCGILHILFALINTNIVLLPGTSPISKQPYRVVVNELEELKKQLRD
jgi:hypothetical protein